VKQRSSSLTVGEQFCAVFIPFFAIIDVLVSSVGQCFDCRSTSPRTCQHADLERLARESQCWFSFCFCLSLSLSFIPCPMCCIRSWINGSSKWLCLEVDKFEKFVSFLQFQSMKLKLCMSYSRNWAVQLLMTAWFTRSVFSLSDMSSWWIFHRLMIITWLLFLYVCDSLLSRH